MNIETLDIIQETNYQLIKIPNNFKIDDNKVYIKKIGNTLQLIPVHNVWENFIENVNNFSDDFMNERPEFIESKRENLE